MFFKRVILWYGMLCYPMLGYGMESMVCYEISMLCYEISMLRYTMVNVVKDKHSATVQPMQNTKNAEHKKKNRLDWYCYCHIVPYTTLVQLILRTPHFSTWNNMFYLQDKVLFLQSDRHPFLDYTPVEVGLLSDTVLPHTLCLYLVELMSVVF